ncbi:MAG: phosphate ABC transporter substrate-binding protein [Planctomycetota bacterium]|nr:phosphate ABC transporter substrate-binding protein [Planctomycetota bacterium]
MALAIAIFAAFSAGNGRAEDESVRCGGSTTLLPVMAQAASDFMEKYGTWNKADASLPEQETLIFVTGGGSGFGVRGAINGSVHIGMASRDLKAKEAEKLGEHKTFLVGKDCVAIAVNKDNPLARKKTGFTSEEAAKLFAGEYKTYKDLDPELPETEIVLFVRDAGAGAAEIMKDVIMKDRPVSDKAMQLPSQGALLKKLEENVNAVAYISSGLVNQSEKLKAFELDGVAPTNANVINGTYKLSRPLLLLVKGEPSAKAKKFIEFILGDAGQKLVSKQGYVAVKDAEQ